MCLNNITKLDQFFKEGEYYIASEDSWFIPGSEVLLSENIGDGMGLFEGEKLIENDNDDVKTHWAKKGYKVGDIVVDREVCPYEEFDLEATRAKKISKIIGE